MLARSLVIHEPAIVGELSLTQNQIMRYLGEYQNYCPVSFKSKVTNKFFIIKHFFYNRNNSQLLISAINN